MYKTKIEDVTLSQIDKFTDYRGDIYTIWNRDVHIDYNLDKISKSRKNVIRGIHGGSL